MFDEITKTMEQLSPENLKCIIGYAGFLLKSQNDEIKEQVKTPEQYQEEGRQRVEESRRKYEAIMDNLPIESADLIRIVGHSTPFAHVSRDEIRAMHDIYGGLGSEMFALAVSFEAGYIRGLRAGRKQMNRRLLK
ncbi:MAG: hypothetical protein ACM3XR_02165 [Bacillota bacterium]